jgi:ligand-binding sensor domain-containing protein/signal transduction histidine kinase
MDLMARALAVLAGMLLASGSCALALNPALDVSQYGHASWKYREGFAKGEIQCIAQTSDGYLWLGTSLGLLRFDGVTTAAWEPPKDQRLPSSDIVRIVAGRDGSLWIGTRNGLASWKNGKLTQYAEFAGLRVSRILEDHEGSIWVGARGIPDGKLCEIRSGSIRCHPEIGGLGHGVFGLHEDAKGNLWVGLLAGVWRWKPGPPQFYPVPGEPNGIQDMVDGGDGGLLISTKAGLMRLADGKVQMAYPFPGAIRGFSATHLLRDRSGDLWVGTFGRGLVHIHQGRTDVFSQADGLTGDEVLNFFEDLEGNIWVATQGGLDRFRELPVVTYSSAQGSALPLAVLAARDGSIWLSTTDGLTRIDHGQVTLYREHGASTKAGVREIALHGLPEHGLGSLFQDSRGRIWVSTLKGIGYLENGRFVSTPAPGRVSGFVEDPAGNLWINHQNLGLFRLSPGNEVQQIPWDTFGRKDPARIIIDPVQGGLWLGFLDGVVYYRDGQVRARYTAAEGLAEGRVSSLRFDRSGALWVATEGGLSRLKNGRIATLTSKNGLPCDAVHWMMEDDSGSVWLGMPCGLARIDRSDFDAWTNNPNHRVDAGVFDTSDGVRIPSGAGGYGPRAAKSQDGKLWFGAMDGLSVVDPRHLPFNKLPPPVHVEQITADRKIYDANAGLRLPPLVRDVVIDYTALSFTDPQKVRFRYKLEGKDRDWYDVGGRRQAFFEDLAPRNYRFRVMACNNSGVWNEAGASFDFSVAPAYYQTLWFQALCVAAFLALLVALYRLRLMYLTRQFNVRMEERVNERLRVARDLHDTMLQSFQGVLMKLSVVPYMIRDRPEVEEKLEQVIKQGRQAMDEGRHAVQGLRSSTVVTNDLARAIGVLGEGMAAERGGRNAPEFCLQVEGESRDLLPLVRDEAYRIAGEAVRNAFRHAEAKRIEVEIQYGKRQFRLKVQDDGKGIDPHVLDAGGRVGHHGLPGMAERAKLVEGQLAVRSRAGAGTEVELTIPGAVAYAKSPAARSASSGRGSG